MVCLVGSGPGTVPPVSPLLAAAGLFFLLALAGGVLAVLPGNLRRFRRRRPAGGGHGSAAPVAGWPPGLAWPVLLAALTATVLFSLLVSFRPGPFARGDGPHVLALLQVLVLEGVFVLALFHRLRRRHLGLWQLGLDRPRAAHLRDGVHAYLSFLPVVLILGLLIFRLVGDSFTGQEVFVMLRALESPASLLLAVLVVGLVAPLLEEIIFRGFLHATLRNLLPPAAALAVGALVFALLHFSLLVLLPLFLFGLLLGRLYERSGSLWPPVVTHALNNLVALFFFVVATRAAA